LQEGSILKTIVLHFYAWSCVLAEIMMTSFPLSVLKSLFFRLLVGHSPLSGSFSRPLLSGGANL
jgi:hypothetical protein